MKELDFQWTKLSVEDIVTNEIISKLEVIVGPLSTDCKEFLVVNTKLRPTVKGEIIEAGGSFEDGNLYYLYGGIARSCYSNTRGKEFCTRIWNEQQIIFNLNSFVNREIRKETIQMLENGILLTISYQNLEYLKDTYPKIVFLLLYLLADNEEFNKFHQHILKLPVEDRVRIYLDKQPIIRDRVKKDVIALHLGISRSKFHDAYVLYKENKMTKHIEAV